MTVDIRRTNAGFGSRQLSGRRSSSYSFETFQTEAQLQDLEPEWVELFHRSGTRNPFAHPVWVRTWLRHFVPDEGRRVVVAVRRDGEAAAVAPFYRRPYGFGLLRGHCLQLAGASPGPDDPLTEMSEILTIGEGRRRTLRALVHHLAVEHLYGCDWIGLTLPPEQGWFETDWVPEAWQRRGAFAVHKQARPYVVLALTRRWEDVPLKRNLKEAIRRGQNRLAALGKSHEVVFVEGENAPTAIEAVIDLHRRRATVRDHLEHDDYFEDESTAQFAREAAARLARLGGATVALLNVDGQPIAGRLVLRANEGVFLSFSGADPEYWQLSAATSLLVACLRDAIDRGEKVANLSINPDDAKLRWSEDLELHNEFLVVRPSSRSRRMFRLYWQLHANQSFTRARRSFVPGASRRRP